MRVVNLRDTDGNLTRIVIGCEDVAWQLNRFFCLEQDITEVSGLVITREEVDALDRSAEELERSNAFLRRFHFRTVDDTSQSE